ncbi:hypothetical protein [Streptomyces sp. XH2]|uniref:hypothetical protein n=1 Tax=Streptomyces sp. XH2 TaxID=3412483 RepID=UPI003C7C42BC
MNTQGVIDLATLIPLPPPAPTAFELLAIVERNAQAHADRIITGAQEQAEDIVTAARAVEEAAGRRSKTAKAEQDEAAAAFAHTQARARALLATNTQLTDGIKEQFDKLLADAGDVAAHLTGRAHELRAEAADANAKATTALNAAHVEAEQLVREARAEAARLLDDARLEAAEQRHQDTVARHQALTKAESDAEEVRKAAAAQAADVTAQADQVLADARTQAEARITEAEEKAAGIVEEADDQSAAMREEARRRLQQVEDREAQSAGRARAEAEQIISGAKAEADKLTASAQERHDRIVAEAEAVLKKACDDEARRKSRSAKWQRVSERAWRAAPWLALLAAVGLAAIGEYKLALLLGFEVFSPLLPIAVDVYCVTAFKKKRDVIPALMLMAGLNVIYHVMHPPEGVPIQLIIGVVIAFVCVVWRVHNLTGDHGKKDPDGSVGGAADGRTEQSDEPPGVPRTPDPRTGRTPPPPRPPVRPGRTDRTDEARTPRTPKSRTDRTDRRTGKDRTAEKPPARTDAEAVAHLLTLPVADDGFLTVNQARTALGCRHDKAVRLLAEAGRLRPADAAKYGVTTPAPAATAG